MSEVSKHLFLDDRFACFSNWYKVKKTVAWFLRLKRQTITVSFEPISADDMEQAKIEIIKCAHRGALAAEIVFIQPMISVNSEDVF